MTTELVHIYVDWDAPAPELLDRIRAASAAGAPLATKVGERNLLLVDARLDSGERDDGTPGTILEVDPLVVACRPGSLELVRCRWEGEDEILDGAELARRGIRYRRFRS